MDEAAAAEVDADVRNPLAAGAEEHQVAGLHLVARLPEGCNDQELAARAADAGIEVRALSAYGLRAKPAGLVLGYGQLRPREIGPAVLRLSRCLRASSMT